MDARRIISKLGGVRPAAQKLGFPPSTVNNWCVRNRIPYQHWNRIIKASDERDLGVTLGDFVGRLVKKNRPQAANPGGR